MIAKAKANKGKVATDGQMMAVFGKERKDGKMRYWVSISTPETDKDGTKTGEYFNASIQAFLSANAQGWFESHAKETSNPEIYGAKFAVTDYWLKAVPGTDKDYIAIFINAMHCDEEN